MSYFMSGIGFFEGYFGPFVFQLKIIATQSRNEKTRILRRKTRGFLADGEGFDEKDATIYNENSCVDECSTSGTKCVTLLENSDLSPDDRQALQTIINLWPELPPETKIEILQLIESVSLNQRV